MEYCRYGLRLDLRGAGEERARKVLALRGLCVAVELMGGTSRLSSRDPVASRIKCETHGRARKERRSRVGFGGFRLKTISKTG